MTWANVVTLVRTVAAVCIGGVALVTARLDLLAIAYAVYWIGDMCDGFVARKLGQETRLGAVFDVVSDRACTSIYFDQVDTTVYWLNWSPVAKATNTAAVVLLALAGFEMVAVLLVAGLVVVKTWSGIRVLTLLGLLGGQQQDVNQPSAS